MPETASPITDALRLPASDRTGLGKALAAERQAQGITQRQMEAATTVPQGRISRIERGTAHAALWEIAAIGAVLGLDAEIVITRREGRTP
ncbi:helix-turn-helix transcriptional regulator [Microbacterium sp. NPDC077644]|uniref:helix-turn-helix domain-containing protein n=1 Tax=Microbacterium sp. NPDC077644 TaxID=3155055 RepID=UPI00344E2F06